LSFASTNIDDVFLLLSFFADPKFRARYVVIGQYIGIGVLYSTSLGASFVSLVTPSAYLGLLGLVPVAIGLKRLIDLRRDKEEKEEKINGRLAEGASARILSVSVVTMVHGGDNIGIYLYASLRDPLALADRSNGPRIRRDDRSVVPHRSLDG
jgi:cadmium resistance protein CadD (predicted permease)